MIVSLSKASPGRARQEAQDAGAQRRLHQRLEARLEVGRFARATLPGSWRGAPRRSRHPRATSAAAFAGSAFAGGPCGRSAVWYCSISCFIRTASALRCPWQVTGVGAAARLDEHVREKQVGVDADRGHMDNMDRMFFSAEQLRRVVNHRSRGDQHLGRKEPVAARQPAGAKHVALGERLPLPPEEQRRAPRRWRPTRPPPESRGRQPRPDATLNPITMPELDRQRCESPA